MHDDRERETTAAGIRGSSAEASNHARDDLPSEMPHGEGGEGKGDADIDPWWLGEIQRQYDQIVSGEARLIDNDEVIAELWARYG